jgi:hypothetical protein
MVKWLRTYSLNKKVKGDEGFKLSLLHLKLVGMWFRLLELKLNGFSS